MMILTLPPVDFLAVCLVLAICKVGQREELEKRVVWFGWVERRKRRVRGACRPKVETATMTMKMKVKKRKWLVEWKE